ncbi:MAG: hypothetical protein ACNA70_03285 [Brevefilum sp.]
MANHETRLFTLSLWQVQQGDDPHMTTWRGKLQSLPDGEAHYFRDWEVLIEHLERMLAARCDSLDPQEVAQ